MVVTERPKEEQEFHPDRKPRQLVGISWRSIFIGALLIPLNAYWVMCVEGIYHKGHPSVMTLPWNVVTTILGLIIINQFLKRLVPKHALTQPELITVYVMVWTVTMLAGHDSLQLQIPAMSYPAYFADETNNWSEIFLSKLPSWLTVTDMNIIRGFYEANDSFYKLEYIRAWLTPVLWWVSFITALGIVTICANIIMRKQWAENERLSFPVVQLPMAITKDGGSGEFWRNKLLWLGIAIGASIDLINGLHFLYPGIPLIQVRHEIPEPVSAPWNGLGILPVPLYPFIIALGYMLPVDMSFSIWFFYLFRKMQDVLFTAYPVVENRWNAYAMQSFGAWVVYFIFAMYMAKNHLRGVWKRVRNQPGGVDDSEEPVSYRTALLGILLGLAYLIFFTRKMGVGPFVVVAIFGIYFIITIAIGRMRAELGPPAHEMAGMEAGTILTVIAGSKMLGPVNLALLPLFYWFVGRGYRTNIGAGQLEGFKMAYESNASPRRLGWAMLIAIVLGALATYWAALAMEYSVPSQPGDQVAHGRGQWTSAANAILNPTGPDAVGIINILCGAGFASLLFYLRHLFPWWPFHPAGYALGMAFGVDYFWSCMLVAWILKLLTLRFGGLKIYRFLLPLAYGVIIGEFIVGAMWSIISIQLGQFIYDFSPG